MNLFVYGILQYPSTVGAITGKVFESHKATLKHYTISNTYPRFIYPNADGVVEGYVLYGIDPISLQAIDHVEMNGTMYQRHPVIAFDLMDNKLIDCEVYEGKNIRERLSTEWLE